MVAYSVVIPAHNERESLGDLLAELAAVMDSLGRDYEVVVVDDGSTDGTGEMLQGFLERSPALRLLQLDRNYGQSTALEAGFRAARGEVLITLDADGQNPPGEIPKLLEHIGPFDAVCGWRQQRCDSVVKRCSSWVANGVRRAVLRDGIHDTGCSLKVLRRECVENLKLYRGMHRFLPALILMEGYRVTEVAVAHRPRTAGRTHYGIWNRLWGSLVDLRTVRWMQRRSRRYAVAERSRPAEAAERPPGPHRADVPVSVAHGSQVTRRKRGDGPVE